MTRELLINAGVGEIRIAAVRDGRLVQFSLERTLEDADRRHGSLVGDIVLGRVEKIVPALNAAFVDFGRERSGFLSARDALPLGGEQISTCVREGEKLVLQVTRDPIGDKGARLSAAVSLAGRLCVLTPERPGLTLSRRIEDDAERKRLTALCEKLVSDSMGLILRTAAAGASRQDLANDVENLMDTWKRVSETRAEPPAMLHHELGPVARTLRDVVTPDVTRIVIDDSEALLEAREYCRRAMPAFEQRVELFSGPGGLLDDWEDEIEKLRHARVPLRSGGWITIESTEALTAIDVNSGGFLQSANREDTALSVNLEAAAEIGAQLCLRGIAGLIVVDFIHTEGTRQRDRIVSALREALAQDAVPAQVSAMSDLSLVTVTRRRAGEPLAKRLTVSCSCCSGAGRVSAEDTVAWTALRRAEREARANPGRSIVIRAGSGVVAWLQAHRDNLMPRLERRGLARVSFEAEPNFTREEFDVRAE